MKTKLTPDRFHVCNRKGEIDVSKAREILDRYDELEENFENNMNELDFANVSNLMANATSRFRRMMFPASDVSAAMNAALTAVKVTGAQKAAAITAASRFPGAGAAGRAMLFPGAGMASTGGAAAVEGSTLASMLSAGLAKVGITGTMQIPALTAALEHWAFHLLF